MAKPKKNKKAKPLPKQVSDSVVGDYGNGGGTSIMENKIGAEVSDVDGDTTATALSSGLSPVGLNKNGVSATNGDTSNTVSMRENLDDLSWLRECETRHDLNGEPYLQLEYQEDDELIRILQNFLERSAATKQVVQDIYQIWQQTVLSTLLASSSLWKQETVTSKDQRQMRDQLKLSRYKVNFIMHHAVGSMLTSSDPKWIERKDDLLSLCLETVRLLPRLAESCPHHRTDIRQAIIHFEGKEFLAAVACETWDTLYDYAVPIDPVQFIPILRRCAMLDILDKDWNMLGGWEDILKGLEAKCCPTVAIYRLPADPILHEQTTILRNARNSMQCKFFSVRFMRYNEDQAPQRWRYFPKCSAPACASIETPARPHRYRCKSCWYFHYCSVACQEYCDNIMGLHPKFCKDTPKAKAALCRKETEQYLGWTHPSDLNGGQLACHACGAVDEEHEPAKSDSNQQCIQAGESGTSVSSLSKMKRCQQCHRVFYCSRQCQEWDWRVGGHKQQCKPYSSSNKNSTSWNGGSGEDT